MARRPRPGSRGMSGHHRPVRGETDDWLTPPEILDALGPFDLDPCCPAVMPWRTAAVMLSEGGLEAEWRGRVWLNPPYGPDAGRWLRRLADHGTGTALVHARTETAWWFDAIWTRASAVLFRETRIHFHFPSGARAPHNSGAPAAFVAYGEPDAAILRRSGIPGAYIPLDRATIRRMADGDRRRDDDDRG